MRRAVWALALLAGCKITTNAANPTALERQLAGAYEDLDRELVLASSVRGEGGNEPQSFAALKLLALEGRAMMRFNEDDVRELKRAGCVAESREGALVARECAAPIAEALARVVEQENRARGAVIEFAAFAIAREQGRAAASSAEVAELRRAYFSLLSRAAKPGELFEGEPGVFAPLAGPAQPSP